MPSGPRFAVATPHDDATQAALAAFDAGGNAVDAALAANAVLSVVYPHMCGLGGDLFALVADGSNLSVVNGSGPAARRTDPNQLRAAYAAFPNYGALTVTVPGVVRSWELLATRFGKLGLRSALEPAVRIAAGGVPVAASLGRAIWKHRDRIQADVGLKSLLLDGSNLPVSRLVQHQLARTLELIAEHGADALYRGPVASAMVSLLQDMGSVLSQDDFSIYHAVETRPLIRSYRDFQVAVPPPNSQGFVLLEILRSIQTSAVVPDHLGPQASVLSRIFERVSTDRDMYLGDSGPVEKEIDDLLDDKRLVAIAARAQTAAPSSAVNSRATGDTVGVVAGEVGGMWIAINQSLYHAFGSGILDPNSGVIFHNRGSFFSLDPASPNFVRPGRRPAHTLMPTILLRDGDPFAASATMGGSAHAQIHAEVLMGLIDQSKTPADAVATPRWLVGGLSRYGGSTIISEGDVPESVLASFRDEGVVVETVGTKDELVGHAQLVALSADQLSAASDERADGSAGYR